MTVLCTQSRRLGGLLLALGCTSAAISGCSPTGYRLQADREAYAVIAERNLDARWAAAGYSIEIDPRSRYFDSHDPDRSPMPPDDPASQEYMRVVNGTKGWKHWYDNGERIELENPAWREELAGFVETTEDGSVKLNVNSALKLAYMHSPSHQDQLETLYLSALDVTAERFRLETQFFGGHDAAYAHNGSLAPAGLSFDSASGQFVVTPSADVDGLESNRLTMASALRLERRFATAGQLLAGFANSFVFEFTGGDANLSASLANFTFIQPLLRGAGKDVALERLTSIERTLLANLRAYGQFRQGFYTQVAIGELGVTGPQRGGRGTNLTVFSGQAGVSGYIGLLQQLQQIRNSEDNLSLQLRTLAQLEALLDVGVIDLVQVDQFRQSVENERDNLLKSRNRLALALDRYKTSTLGLPPELPVELDDTLIRQFQLVTREATAIQDSIVELQDRVGELPDDSGVEAVRQVLAGAARLVEPFREQLNDVQENLVGMETAAPDREQTMTNEEQKLFRRDRARLVTTLADVEQKFSQAQAKLKSIQAGLTEKTRKATVREVVVWLGNLFRIVQRSVLVQARARLESVTVGSIDLKSDRAFKIALANRLDFMNGRAALVDSWRLIQVNADALQSILNLTASGGMQTAKNNPASFRAPTGDLQLGLEFDAPFTRLLERNSYRESLVNYQRSRRGLIRSRDSLHLGLRELLRQIKQLRTSLEIQRRAVAIAIRRVDLTRSALYAPVPPPQPGQGAAQFGPTAAQNLLAALSSLRNTQNNFMGVWLNYYAARMRLSRELGVMVVDQDGIWIDEPIPDTIENLPPSEDDPAAQEPPVAPTPSTI